MVKGSEMAQTAKNVAQTPDVQQSQRGAFDPLAGIQRFSDVDREYARARETAWLAAQRRWEAAQRRHAEVVAALQKDVQSRLEQAFKTGADAWDATRSDTWSAQYEELSRQYLAATSSILQEARARFVDSIRSLNKEYEDVGTEFDSAARGAYRDYLRSLQSTWRELNVDAVVDGLTLARALGPRM